MVWLDWLRRCLVLRDIISVKFASRIDTVGCCWSAMLGTKARNLLVSNYVCCVSYVNFVVVAADGVCEPSMMVIGLAVVVAVVLLLFCCCCVCLCLRQRMTIRRNLMDDF